MKFILIRVHYSVQECWGIFDSEADAEAYRDTLPRKFEGYDEFSVVPITLVQP